MSKSILQTAKSLMRRRNFSFAISVLESESERYEDNFDYYLTMGICYLYLGLSGNAYQSFQKARNIRMTDSTLLIGQAALFLKRGDTRRAVQYYLEVLDRNPENKTAKSALEFLKGKDDRTIIECADSGKLEKFYPPLGFNYCALMKYVFSIVLGLSLGVFIFNMIKPKVVSYEDARRNISNLVLSSDERKNPQEKDLSSSVIHYYMSEGEITRTYENALDYFATGRDNMSQKEINRILNSNASVSIRQKANILMGYLEEPDFATLKDNFTYQEVASEKELYLDCWVDWSGRIANVRSSEDSSKYVFDLLVGYEDQKKLEGTVSVIFDSAPVPEILGDRPLRVLGKISIDSGILVIKGKSVYQMIKN